MKQVTLSEAAIRRYVGPTSFERGEKYFHQGRILHARREGSTLQADCVGSYDNLYRVSATVEGGEIVDASCSCPVGDDGGCKHVAALLLTWLDAPNIFRDSEELTKLLQQHSKEELIALIKRMLSQQPALEEILELPLPTSGKPQEVDPEIYRQQAAAAFRHTSREWAVEAAIASKLAKLLDLAGEFLEQDNAKNALPIYEAVFSEVKAHFEEFSDEGYALRGVVARCVGGLAECLTITSGDDELHARVLHLLFQTFRFDQRHGGVGTADEVPDIIAEYGSEADKKQVAAWLRELLGQESRDDWTSKYYRQVYGGFLLKLQAEDLDDESFIALCRETGRLEDLLERLLKLGHVQEAAAEATKAEDYDLPHLAEQFIQYGQVDTAEHLMEKRARTSKDARLSEWLETHYAAKGEMTDALAWSRKLFELHPSLEQYRKLHTLATELGRWEHLRPQLLAELTAAQQLYILTQIHLDEGQVEAALKTMQQLQYPNSELLVQVAHAAEPSHPREALRIYLQQAEGIVRARNRAAYAQACQHLVRVRMLYGALGEKARWEQYLEKLQRETKILRAFRQEMAKAGL